MKENLEIIKLIEKAERKLKTANSLFENKEYEDAVSRAYYAMFLSLKALLLTKGISVKTHKGALALFSEHFVKTGKIEKHYYAIISRAKDTRESSDYDAFYEPDPEEVKVILEDAKKFVDRIKEKLNG